MKLEMKDRPGQLVAALQPISAVGGNIIAVIHQRETSAAAETLDVQIVLELPEGRLETLLELLREQGVSVVRIGEERLLYKCTLIMIGHLMHTDLSDTVDRIDRTGSAEVTELSQKTSISPSPALPTRGAVSSMPAGSTLRRRLPVRGTATPAAPRASAPRTWWRRRITTSSSR
ncbi:MAG: Amino acid-binding ACT domain protein [Methanoculleus marisnigri]|uniref:Amino acid-binding ACT domain protein n=1 Tax=Methanoculleus marisnigri TaxID=2198 RepID=A0A101GLT2_9EURY|nr:MAG: Amino acid-binding ACT domain protein [Methanoculleus marisnigri]